MGTIAQIRAAQGAPPPPLARSPERQAVAEAIAGSADLEAEITRANDALAKARGLYRATEAEADRIEREIEGARDGAPQRLVDRLMDGTADGADPLEHLQAKLTKARTAWDVQHKAALIIEEEVRRLEQRRAYSRLNDAMGAVVRAEALGALIAEYDRRHAALLEITAVLAENSSFTRFDPWHQRPNPPFSSVAAQAWKAAIERLRTDPDAPLPTVAE